MKEYLPFLVIGLATGSVYALAALGLTVTYVTSGVFNFAHGAVGMISAYFFYTLREENGLPTPLALLLTIAVFAPVIGILLDRFLFAKLRGCPTSTYVVASLGLLVALQGLAVYQYGGTTRRMIPLLAEGHFRAPGVNVGYDQLTLMIVAAATGAALWGYLRFTHLGLQTRALVEDRELIELVGANTGLLSSFSWMLGSSFAALSGVLLSATVGLNSVILTLLVVQAFGAAALGRFTSLPFTYIGALLIGIAASVSTKFAAEIPQLVGMPTSLPFIVLFVVLVVSPRQHFQEVSDAREVVHARTAGSALPDLLRVGPLLLVLGVLPWLVSGPRLLVATATLIYVLVFRSMGVLVGLSRQVSLCQAAFVALGATTTAHLLDAGVPFLLALLIGALAVVPVGALVALPAIRLSGLFLALATLGYGLLLEALVYPMGVAFGKSGIVTMSRPSFLQSDIDFYFFVLAAVAAGVLVLEAASRVRVSRVLRALADSPLALRSLGINPVGPRVLVFCLCTFMTALAGGLVVSLYGAVAYSNFEFFQSLLWLTVLVTAGPHGLWGAILAALLFFTVPNEIEIESIDEILPIIFGVQAILLAQRANGIIGETKEAVHKVRRWATA